METIRKLAAQALLNAPNIGTTKTLPDHAIIAVLLGCVRCVGARWRRAPMGAVRADSSRRRQSLQGARIRRTGRYGDGTLASAISDRGFGMSAFRPLAVAAADDGRLAPETSRRHRA